jgi:hypothetical protein
MLQCCPAFITVARSQVVLETAITAVKRKFSTGHGNKGSMRSFDHLQVSDYETIIEGNRTKRLQAVLGITYKLDSYLSDFHHDPPQAEQTG